MAAGKEIRGKIKSVENTKKITKAMEMVAASKMRKAQDRMRSARPYAEKIGNMAANLSQANPEFVHPFMKPQAGGATGFIVVTTDKGLCGGLNTNVLRALTIKLREIDAAGGKSELVAIGNKGYSFLTRIGAKRDLSRDAAGRPASPRPDDRSGQGDARRPMPKGASARCTSAPRSSSARCGRSR